MMILGMMMRFSNALQTKNSKDGGDANKFQVMSQAAMLFYKGARYYESKNYLMATKLFKEAAKEGFVGAQFFLSDCYYHGHGVKENIKQAFYWTKKAAEQGDEISQMNLGHMYEMGEGVPENLKLAAHWYKRAAKQGFAHAQRYLGELYEYGKGVRLSSRKALSWYRKAALADNEYAQYSLGSAYYFGIDGILKRNENQARFWYQKVKNNKNASQETKNIAEAMLHNLKDGSDAVGKKK
ncbi:MAG: sel1 repeat family protein [Prevotellaceae bacterium]|nr:sel1 repeat family protein [Prevotellaceae bacterium]